MTNMSIQPLWMTYFIEILLVLEFLLTKTYFGTIDTIILVMEIPRKPKMGKPVQQSDIDFIMRKYGTFTITANSPKPSESNTQ